MATHECNVVLLIGPPASGKTTLGQQLAKFYGYTHFDIGAHVRQTLPPETDQEQFVVEAVESLLKTETYVLLNGFPKYPHGLHLLTRQWAWARIHLVILLEVGDENVLRQRARRRHLRGERPEDNEANFEQRLQKYTEVTLPVVRDISSTTGARIARLRGTLEQAQVESMARDLWSKAGVPGIGSLSSSDHGSRSRWDPEEADIEVSVCLMSGEERMRPLLPARSTVSTLRRVLIEDGEKDFHLRFFFNEQEINDLDVICSFNGFTNGATITMTREEKPPTPPSYSCARVRSVCFTSDSLACVLSGGGTEVRVPFSEIQVGDLVRTEQHGGFESYRRVQRVWAHGWWDRIRTFELAPGCRVTPGHPVRRNGQWVRPEDIGRGEETFEEMVYQLEVEGHVDTVLVGGVVCALLGRYCGPGFGWNVFTRKTVACDRQPCPKCAKAVVPGLSFSPTMLPADMLPPASFEPY